MKYISIVLICLFAFGCTQRTQYGPCIGFANEEEKTLEYELSLWNAFIAGLFSETIVIPLYTVAFDIKCPVGYKK